MTEDHQRLAEAQNRVIQDLKKLKEQADRSWVRRAWDSLWRRTRKLKDEELVEKNIRETKSRRERLNAQLRAVTNPKEKQDLEGTAADLEELCGQLLTSSFAAGRRRRGWERLSRVGGALTAVAAAAGGSTLIAGLKPGFWATFAGVAILVIAVVGAAVNAWAPEQEYARNRAKRRAYDALWFEAWNYALYDMVQDDPPAREARLNDFEDRWEQIGET